MRLDVTCSASWDSAATLNFDAHTLARMARATATVDAFGKGTVVGGAPYAPPWPRRAVRYRVRRCA